MSNRTKALEHERVHRRQDPLEALMDSCHRNGRKAILPKPPEKIYFDADRFRWYFKHRDGWNLQQWRDYIDAEMRLQNVPPA